MKHLARRDSKWFVIIFNRVRFHNLILRWFNPPHNFTSPFFHFNIILPSTRMSSSQVFTKPVYVCVSQLHVHTTCTSLSTLLDFITLILSFQPYTLHSSSLWTFSSPLLTYFQIRLFQSFCSRMPHDVCVLFFGRDTCIEFHIHIDPVNLEISVF